MSVHSPGGSGLAGPYPQVLAACNLLRTLLSAERLLVFYSSAPMSLVWFVVTCFMLHKRRQLSTVIALKTPCCHHLSQSISSTRPGASGPRGLGLISLLCHESPIQCVTHGWHSINDTDCSAEEGWEDGKLEPGRPMEVALTRALARSDKA